MHDDLVLSDRAAASSSVVVLMGHTPWTGRSKSSSYLRFLDLSPPRCFSSVMSLAALCRCVVCLETAVFQVLPVIVIVGSPALKPLQTLLVTLALSHSPASRAIAHHTRFPEQNHDESSVINSPVQNFSLLFQ